MEFGQNKLLTIAIPTWNRADKLRSALSFLLPQIYQNKEYIEFIISDNASTDNTAEAVANISRLYPDLKYIYNKQTENTGFFGNFHKCISLGTGKYFWLLSDDDFVMPNVIDIIIDTIKGNEVGAVFLDGWTNNYKNIEVLSIQYVNQNDFFNDRPFRHSLISSVIYRHIVHGDDEIFEKLAGNALIGYAVYLKAINGFNEFGIIKGNSINARNDEEVRFNALKIFTLDLKELILYNKKCFTPKIISNITNSFIETNIFVHFKAFKYKNKYRDNNYLNLIHFFFHYKNFWIYLLPVLLTPTFIYNIYARLTSHIISKN